MILKSIKQDRAVILWLLTGCLFIYLLLVVGCLTRLTHSGLSITDWSFMGSIPPFSESQWLERFAKYQESPEFQKINYTMTLAEFKPIFLWEYIHRMIGRTMMYVFIVGMIVFAIKRKIRKEMLPQFGLLFLIGAMQAVIGWWMVYSGLQKQPAVSHYRLATHLMSALTLFAFTFWFALKLIYQDNKDSAEQKPKSIKRLVIIYFLVLVTQIIFGAFTAGFVEGDNAKVRPGHIFNTWPKMGDEWVSDLVFSKSSLFQDLFENAAGIQFVHRTLALLLVILTIVIWRKSLKFQLTKSIYNGITLLIYGLTVQFILGVLTLLYNVPIVLGTLHQTGAFFLFAVSIFLIFQFYHKPKLNG